MAEAVLLAGRVGETFDAIVVDDGERGTVVQIAEPAVLSPRSAQLTSTPATPSAPVLAADHARASISGASAGAAVLGTVMPSHVDRRARGP